MGLRGGDQVADNQTGLNSQYEVSQFGLDASAYTSSGAPGSPGVTAGMTAGPVVGTPVVSVPGASSQLSESVPRLPVTSGDTSGMSSDAPVPAGGDPLTGLSLGQVTLTGAGSGSVGGPGNPNAMDVPGLAAQTEAARRPS